MTEFWRNGNMDAMIEDIIDIFMNIPGVELVRLSGLLSRGKNISKIDSLTAESIDNIVRKLKANGIINYKFIMYCPYCSEVTYQIIDRDVTIPKLCDTCNTLYSLVSGSSLEIE